MSVRRLTWMLRVYAAGLIGTLGAILSWETLGWWGALFGIPLLGAFYAALVEPDAAAPAVEEQR